VGVERGPIGSNRSIGEGPALRVICHYLLDPWLYLAGN